MDRAFYFDIEEGRVKVPVSKELYNKNYEYYKGMGIYDESVCQEKAMLTTGFQIIRSK